MDQKEIGRIFYRDGYRLALNHLEKELSASNLEAAIGKLYQAVDELLEAFLQRSALEGISSDCKLGCAWCCHQEVFALSHEFLFLNEYVNQHLSREIRMRILEKAREKVKLTMNKTVEEQLKIRSACPFLESGSCLKQMGLQVAELPIEQGYSTMVTLGQSMDDWVSNR